MITPVSSFARKARWHVVRIEGPVAWTAIHDLRGLHEALGHKIEELECEQPTAKTAPMSPILKVHHGAGCVLNTHDSTKVSAS